MAEIDRLLDEATGPTFVQALSGAFLGSTVNVLLHYIGPQKTREALQMVFACADRHHQTPCPGECTFHEDVASILTPYLADFAADDTLTELIDVIASVSILTELTADQSSQMVTAVFNMHGVDTAKVEHAVA